MLLNGEVVRDVTRRMGYTFQQSTRLPWRTIRGNVGFGLELRGVRPTGSAPVVNRLLDQMGLTLFADAHPTSSRAAWPSATRSPAC